MSDLESLGSAAAQVRDFSWKNYTRIIDLGGSMGSFLAEILIHNPNLKGLLFDRPSVIAQATNIWTAEATPRYTSIIPKVTLLAGSLFNSSSLPDFREGDAIHLRYILHDWSDQQCLEILIAIRSKIGKLPNIKLIINEMVLTAKDSVPFKYLFDLHMKLINGNAMERYAHQWEALFDSAGFKLVSITPTRSLNSIMLVSPK